jgi:hypothetical protein
VLLPLLPSNNPPNNYPAGRVMILGGGNKANATATTEIIDFSQHTPQWVRMGDMPSGRRVEGNSVLLPSGAFPDSLGHGGSTVFVQGGSAINENASTATLGADLFDPATNKWFDRATNTWSSSSAKPGGAGFAKYPRLYHSVALLLPDATVLTAGSNPQRGTFDQHIEIYSPAYLYDATGALAKRPVIAGAPAQITNNGDTFQVQTPDANTIDSVVLVKPGSDTHAFDMEQRLVGLHFTAIPGALTVKSPLNPNLAPPGYYMLFVVNRSVLNRPGVPSVAKFVQVVPATQLGDKAPIGKITSPPGDVAIPVGQSVSFAGPPRTPMALCRPTRGSFRRGIRTQAPSPSPISRFFSTTWERTPQLTSRR